MVLWGLFGISAGFYRGETEKEPGNRKTARYIPLGAASVVVVLILLGSICLLQSHGLMKKGIVLLKSNRVENGVQSMERAVRYAPFNAGYHITLSQVYKSLGKNEKAMEEADQAVNLSQYDIRPRNNLIKIAVAAGNYEKAASAAGELIKLAPNEISVYETYAKVFNKLGLEELKTGNKEQAKEYFAVALKTPENKCQPNDGYRVVNLLEKL